MVAASSTRSADENVHVSGPPIIIGQAGIPDRGVNALDFPGLVKDNGDVRRSKTAGRIPESVRITPVDNGMHRHGPSFRVIGLIRVLDTVMRGRSPAQTSAIALMHLLTILRKIRAENIRHCIAPK